MSEEKQNPESNNILKIGVSSISELEEKIKAFRAINLNVKKRRYILSRETLLDFRQQIIIKKSDEFDYAKIMFLKRDKTKTFYKTFQPDEGIVILSDMSSPVGIQMSMDLVTQVMNIGGGAYEAFIDRIDSFKEMSTLLSKALFPKLILVGYISDEKKKEELAYYNIIRKLDPYIRILEITHSTIKPNQIIEKARQVHIVPEEKDSWKRFIVEIINEYTRPYSLEGL